MSSNSVVIRDYPFPGAEQEVAATTHGTNWPVVYLIYNDSEVYVGETTSAYVRYGQHASENGKYFKDRRRLNRISIIFDDLFNKSAILDIEQNLIHLMEADAAIQEENGGHGRKLQNRNAGQSYAHDYYNRTIYQAKVEEVWNRLLKRRFVSNSFLSIKNSDLFKYSPYTSLTAEQELVCRDIIRDIISRLSIGKKGMAVIKGAAGTGKSLVLINMIMTLLRSLYIKYDYDFETDSEDDLDDRYALHAELERFYTNWKTMTGRNSLKIGFVVPMSSIRSTFQMVFKYAGKSTKGMKANIVIGPNAVVTDADEQEYDVVFVDESHRLKRRVAMSGTEMGAFDKCCNKIGLNPHDADQLDFLLRKSKYQVLVYDENQSIKPTDIPVITMNNKISQNVTIRRELRSQMRCQGALAGYSWEWVSSKDKTVPDIELDGRKYFWNKTSSRWILNSAPDEIGCVHTSQGYDLNRVAVIFGREIDYDPATRAITIDRRLFYDSKVKQQTTDAQLKTFILNAYKVMLVRGIKGCYVYACNKNLRDFLHQYIPASFD